MSAESPFPVVLLLYETSSPLVSPRQLVEEIPLLVKALEVIAAGVVPVTGVGFDPFYAVAGI